MPSHTFVTTTKETAWILDECLEPEGYTKKIPIKTRRILECMDRKFKKEPLPVMLDPKPRTIVLETLQELYTTYNVQAKTQAKINAHLSTYLRYFTHYDFCHEARLVTIMVFNIMLKSIETENEDLEDIEEQLFEEAEEEHGEDKGLEFLNDHETAFLALDFVLNPPTGLEIL
jgi:hypothetical protein